MSFPRILRATYALGWFRGQAQSSARSENNPLGIPVPSSTIGSDIGKMTAAQQLRSHARMIRDNGGTLAPPPTCASEMVGDASEVTGAPAEPPGDSDQALMDSMQGSNLGGMEGAADPRQPVPGESLRTSRLPNFLYDPDPCGNSC